MLRHLCVFLLTAFALSASFRPVPTRSPTAQTDADTLTAGVFPPKPIVLKGATRDLASLDIRLIPLDSGKSLKPSKHDSAGHLLIVKEGTIMVGSKTLGPGGVGLFETLPPIVGKTNSSFYLFSLKSRAGADHSRGSILFLADWSDLAMKPTPKGESRAIFGLSTAWFKNINMHATTLNPGEISHPQHMHRAEEILILRSGNVRMHIANGYMPAKGGDIVFLPSGVPHDLENGTAGRTEYFALQWEP